MLGQPPVLSGSNMYWTRRAVTLATTTLFPKGNSTLHLTKAAICLNSAVPASCSNSNRHISTAVICAPADAILCSPSSLFSAVREETASADDFDLVARIQQIAGCLIDADVAFDSGQENLAAAALAQLGLESTEAAGTEAGLGQWLLVGEQGRRPREWWDQALWGTAPAIGWATLGPVRPRREFVAGGRGPRARASARPACLGCR